MMTESPETVLEYRSRFFEVLGGCSSIAAAQAFALQLPAPGTPNPDLHTGLLSFLAAFEGCPGARFTINRRSQLVPDNATEDERQAYVALVRRLTHMGEIASRDCTFAEAQLTKG